MQCATLGTLLGDSLSLVHHFCSFCYRICSFSLSFTASSSLIHYGHTFHWFFCSFGLSFKANSSLNSTIAVSISSFDPSFSPSKLFFVGSTRPSFHQKTEPGKKDKEHVDTVESYGNQQNPSECLLNRLRMVRVCRFNVRLDYLREVSADIKTVLEKIVQQFQRASLHVGLEN